VIAYKHLKCPRFCKFQYLVFLLLILFLKDLKTLYTGFSVKNKQRFLAFIFPKGVYFADGKIRTPEKSCLFEYLEEIEQKKSGNFDLVTLRRIELRLPG
jgi:hypothetical protein